MTDELDPRLNSILIIPQTPLTTAILPPEAMAALMPLSRRLLPPQTRPQTQMSPQSKTKKSS